MSGVQNGFIATSLSVRDPVPEIAPQLYDLTPQTHRLQNSDASRNHHNDVQNRLDAPRHRYVAVNKPQNHPYHKQRDNDIHNQFNASGRRKTGIDHPTDDRDNNKRRQEIH
jgi:hypothetical protein